MAVLARGRAYDRTRLKKRAAAAQKKRKYKKAISLYRKILQHEPESHDIHKKLAPLLARTGQAAEALVSYREAAVGLVQKGFKDQAIGLLRAATAYLPREVALWKSVAELEASRGRTPDAVRALLDGRRHFRSRKLRPQAIQLLLQARKLDPRHFEVSYDLAGLIARAGGRPQALQLLDDLVARSNKRNLRRVRARQLWISPSGPRTWHLIRACILGR